MPDPAIAAVIPSLSNRVRQIMASQGVPGVALGIVSDQELAWCGGFGYADLGAARAMDENTLTGVASISKTFTALAIMQLRDLGKLRLDDPVVQHLPEFKAVTSRVCDPAQTTIRQLLTHRSGLVGESPTGHWNHLKFPAMSEILEALPRVEVVIDPLSAFKYCNLAFSLLGEIVTRRSGRPYAEYVTAEILSPLGMTSSGFEINNATRARTATGYLAERYQDVPEVSPDPPTNGYQAAAGLRTCVVDLAKWVALQFRSGDQPRSGAQVLAGRSISEMHRVGFVEPDFKAGYALTWMAARIGENVYHHHGGSVPGFLSMVAFNKPARAGVVVLTNKQGNNASATIAFEALEMIVAQRARENRTEASPPAPTPEKYKPMLGRYLSSPIFGALVHIEFRGGKLMLVNPPDPFAPPPPPPAPLIPTAEHAVFIVEGGRPSGEKLTFEFDGVGRVTGFILGEHFIDYKKTD